MMKNKRYLLFVVLTLFTSIVCAESLMINTYNRSSISLDGSWNYIVDPYENGYFNYRYQPFDQMEDSGKNAYFSNAKQDDKSELVEYDFDKSDTLTVPGDWNSQKEKLFYYEGTVWYKKSFDFKKTLSSNRVFVYFGAVNYQSDVYLNGEKLGTHIGGFTPFNYEVTGLLKEKDNFLVLKVDNTRKKDAVPTLNTDWWNYGGITRSVKLVEVANSFIQDYMVQLAPTDKSRLKGFVRLNGKNIKNRAVTLSIPEIDFKSNLRTDANGYVELDTKIESITYWSPESPKLYRVVLETRQDKVVDDIGFRTLRTDGPNILVNDEPVFLKGISIHEENPLRGGRAHSLADAEQLLNWAKELGCNFVRLAHYPHNEHMLRLADKMGILVWEENPVYWTISWNNAETYKNAESQLSNVIARDKNRASVIIWSMANETPNSEARLKFLTSLAATARRLDPTRLISAALEQRDYQDNPLVQTIDDPFAEIVDVLAFNEYIGWYNGLPEKLGRVDWHITQNKPVVISEFGAGAKKGYHGDKLTRWSEEYQEDLYQESLKMLEEIDQLRGMSPWILVDFRSPRRPHPVIKEGWNRKGLLSDKGEKKKAYYVLQKYYKNKSVK